MNGYIIVQKRSVKGVSRAANLAAPADTILAALSSCLPGDYQIGFVCDADAESDRR